MDQDKTAVRPPPSPKAEPIAIPSEGELSRIAREAVHQPPDPRLDKQLARMIGVMDPSESAGVAPSQPTAKLSVVSGADLERLQARLRRMEIALVGLAVAVGILAVIAVGLLVR